MRTNVSRAMRALRKRRGWHQADLGRRARLSRDVVHRAEIGKVLGIKVGSLDRLVTALEADLVLEIRWRGAELDSLIDRTHAALVTAAAERLARKDWIVTPEVSFNHYGDRGRCDLVAWNESSRTLLIVEVKSRIGNLQETLGRLDVKVRLGGVIAAELGLGRPAHVVAAIVLGEDGANRRTIARHDAQFRRFDLRGRGAFAWLRAPTGSATGLLWFESPDSGEGRRKHPFVASHRQGAG
jgi:transcriptional regulator with XRE-family HTH domain